MEDMPIGLLVAIIGSVLGCALGATAQRTNFCTMGAISDIVFMGSWSRFRSWMLAIAVAIIGTQLLHVSELIDINKAIYLSPNLGWSSAIIGGLLFGFGMTMSGGCGNKTLVRLGTGNLKSLVVAVFLAIFAYMTLRGLTGLARVQLEDVTVIDLTASGLKGQGIPDLLAAITGLPPEIARWIVLGVFASGLLLFCFKDAEFRGSNRDVLAGLIIGALIPAAWYATGVIGYDEFEPTPLNSFTFVNPTGESLQYLMTFTGSTINFGISTVGGVIFGSFLMAMATKEFRLEGFTDAGDTARHMFGGSIMGIGGIMALGCTIGQGVTGMSTLALGSLIALLSILAGGYYGMKYLEEGSLGGAFAAIFKSD